jgi:hypothetical protein
VYSLALTTKSEVYARTGCDGSNYYYAAIQMNVIESGCYSVESNSTIDIYGYIYKNNFDPFNPTKNLLSQNDGNLNNTQFKFMISLQVNTTYVLVVATYQPSVTGTFSVFVSGPNNVSLNRISEYLYFFLNNQRRIRKYRIYL